MLQALLLLSAAGAAELPVTMLDAPHHFQGPGFGMRSSLELSYSVQRLGLLGTQALGEWILPERELLRTGLGLGVVTGLAQLGFTTWMHEEWHRAPMSQYGIDNQNTYHDPSAWEQAAAGVHLVSDEDLAWLKAEHPADLVRAHTAGIESEYALVRFASDQLLREAHRPLVGPLRTAGSWTTPMLLTAVIGNQSYMQYCGPSSNEPPSDEYEPREEYRDFTGWDCDAWAYDLVLPDEPYEARGTHPSGSGIDRYRVWSDLPEESKEVLTLVTRLSWLNFLDPNLLGINGFAVGEHTMNAAAGMIWTPWGYTVDTRGRLLTGQVLWSADLALGMNRELVMPILTVGADRLPITDRLSADLQLSAWLQPENLRWDDEKAAPGGRVALGARYALRPWLALRVESMAKTQGWVMGEVSLQPELAGRLGLDFEL